MAATLLLPQSRDPITQLVSSWMRIARQPVSPWAHRCRSPCVLEMLGAGDGQGARAVPLPRRWGAGSHQSLPLPWSRTVLGTALRAAQRLPGRRT